MLFMSDGRGFLFPLVYAIFDVLADPKLLPKRPWKAPDMGEELPVMGTSALRAFVYFTSPCKEDLKENGNQAL